MSSDATATWVGAEHAHHLWPWVLLGVAGLFLVDRYAKRVRLFGYRVIKF